MVTERPCGIYPSRNRRIVTVVVDRLSQNVFPNGFSQNCLFYVRKWGAPQTGVGVTIPASARSPVIDVTRPATWSMRRKGMWLGVRSEHPLPVPVYRVLNASAR